MNYKDLVPAIEAIVFATGSPVPIKAIANALDKEEALVEKAINYLMIEYEHKDRGISFIRLDDSVQFCSKKEYVGLIREVMNLKKNTPLSQAAMEVLAVIAYNQPVTKALIEQVRGVDCSGVIGSLCQKGLIEEKGRLELPGRPLIYGTTDNFLRCFSISNLSELPEVKKTSEKEENIDNNDDKNIESGNDNK